MSVYFTSEAVMKRQYPYLRINYLYNLTDYWENPRGEIMVKLLELDHYIRFAPGGVVLSNFIVQN
ncbi:hypothetical protein [Mongoliitalea daihaiensis]|uniref:hypothetical protein n=1 Tax=Mongoliitalea daihaiensis TaxID=2782006 RepID=UPI001F173885|nr:hypothetical protein [Mongoliitalea daihaiensis]UJP63962.1 hypothetical protein IPZ59_14180 [Mongoliitalea daihaiensis]